MDEIIGQEVVCSAPQEHEFVGRVDVEATNRSLAIAEKGVPSEPEMWVLIGWDYFTNKSPRYFNVWRSSSRQRLEQLAKIRGFGDHEIFRVDRSLDIDSLPEASLRERSIACLRQFFNWRNTQNPHPLARLFDAGYETLGEIQDAGYGKLYKLGLNEESVRTIRGAMRRSGILVTKDGAAGDSACRAKTPYATTCKTVQIEPV
jgi:hypothetical protein